MIIKGEDLFLATAVHIIRKFNTNGKSTVSRREFRSFFGVSSKVCSNMWSKYNDVLPKKSIPKHLLWVLLFLKSYNTEDIAASLAGCDRKTFRNKVWPILKAITKRAKRVVSSINHIK